MQISISHVDPVKRASSCLVLFVFEDTTLSASAKAADKASKRAISKLLDTTSFNGKEGDTRLFTTVAGITAKRVLLVGCGKPDNFATRQLQAAVTAASRALISEKLNDAVFVLPDKEMGDFTSQVREAAQAIGNANYNFTECKSKADKPHGLKRALLAVSSRKLANQGKPAAAQGMAIASGMTVAKDLANLPGNICTPSYLARKATAIGRKHSRVRTKILNEKEMEKLKMGALLSVSRGSRQPAKLIIIEYNGGKKGDKPVVLVGKGLTFDAGGISIKPAAKMDEMKYDMCGGASVFGAITAIAEMELPINVVGVVPSSENLPDGDANKPGDIVTSMSGQTIEVLNTDAEGRLILCDALTYSKRFKPDTVIDIATLTGACIVALGNHASGLMANDDDLAGELISAGETSNDRTWRLPLWDEYQPQLDSNFADMANIGGPPAGAITAGCFLSRYTEDYKWAHLDIAGTAWKSGNEKGATGRPVPLLVNYLINKAG